MLIQEIEQVRKKLDQAVALLNKNGQELAKAEYDYKVVLAQTVLRMKDDGQPATLINLIVYGQKAVAEARLKRDIAEVNYNTNQEYINAVLSKSSGGITYDTSGQNLRAS